MVASCEICLNKSGIIRDSANNTNWRVYVAELILNLKDPMIEYNSVPMAPPVGENHYSIPTSNSPTRHVRCVVCGLEQAFRRVFESKQWILVTGLPILWQNEAVKMCFV